MSKLSFDPLINKAAIEFLKGKVPELSDHWDSFIAPVHAKSFTISGSTQLAFVSDMLQALINNKENGLSLREFQSDFENIKAQYGWSHKGSSMWRARVIYDTNIRSAQMASRWQKIQLQKEQFPYLEYRHGNSKVPRIKHLSWDRLILKVDDPFWDTHYPINAFGCKCDVYQIDELMMEADGLSERDSPVIERKDVISSNGNISHNQPVGVDVMFDTNVGQAWLFPDVALAKKLASLPPMIAGRAYENMVTKSYMSAVDKSWAAFRAQTTSTGKAKNEAHFISFLSSKVQLSLEAKSAEIVAQTEKINAGRSASKINNLPQLKMPDLVVENYSVIAIDKRISHLEGNHKQKTPSQWESDWIDQLPSLVRNYQAVLFDTDAQALVYVTKMTKNSDRSAVVYVDFNQKRKKLGVSNWVSSLNTKPLTNLGESRFILIDGYLPK